jgi:protein involved in polysaccharide export with SLBB domain
MKAGLRSWLVIPVLLTLTACHTPYTGTPEFKTAGATPAPMETVTFTNALDPSWLTVPTNFFTLGPGDKLEIELLGEPTSKTTSIVGPDGRIYFNLLPGIDVWGLTLGEAKSALEKELTRFVKQPPQLSVVLRGVESKRVWILGRVQVPGGLLTGGAYNSP